MINIYISIKSLSLDTRKWHCVSQNNLVLQVKLFYVMLNKIIMHRMCDGTQFIKYKANGMSAAMLAIKKEQ